MERRHGAMDSEEKCEGMRIAHLTMVQGIVTRMGSNSFSLKALSAAFGSAAIAVIATVDKPSLYYAVAASVPVVIFWYMDAKYLRIERAYRELFDHVRKGGKIEAYSLDASPFMADVPSVFRLAVSWSVVGFYLAILLSFGTVAFLVCGNV